jgi:predicted amidohydrolase
LLVALASPRPASTLDEGIANVERLVADAAGRGAEIVCFPEAYLPGLRGQDLEVPPWETAEEERARSAALAAARAHGIVAIVGIERIVPGGRQVAALVAGPAGDVLGWQTKNQLDPSEDRFYVPGATRRLFEWKGVRFGIVICHEGWRYPETVRWAARRGAHVVFHPQHTGSTRDGVRRVRWGEPDAPYYEKAMAMRSIENGIYFASVNYALPFQESATSLVAPSGECQAHLPYGIEGVLVEDIDPAAATGLLARRFAPERYEEEEGRA